MRRKMSTSKLTLTALLTAIGILIPMIMPVRIIIGPASFTLASHVPIFLAMFFAPSIASFVALGTTFGFLLAGFPIIIVLRALSHIAFAYIGARMIQNKQSEILNSSVKSLVYSFVIALIHAAAETIIVSVFFFGGLPGAEYTQGFFYSVFLLVGVGTLLHSMVDFLVAQFVWKALESRMNKLVIKLNQ